MKQDKKEKWNTVGNNHYCTRIKADSLIMMKSYSENNIGKKYIIIIIYYNYNKSI